MKSKVYMKGKGYEDIDQILSASIPYKLKPGLASGAIVLDVIASPDTVRPYRTRTMVYEIKQYRHYILWMEKDISELTSS